MVQANVFLWRMSMRFQFGIQARAVRACRLGETPESVTQCAITAAPAAFAYRQQLRLLQTG
jgi:hypothetical protein